MLAGGSATLAQLASENGRILQTATGITGSFGVMAVLLTTTVFEIWLVLFDLANIFAVYNTNGSLGAYSNAFDAPTPEQVAVLSRSVRCRAQRRAPRLAQIATVSSRSPTVRSSRHR